MAKVKGHFKRIIRVPGYHIHSKYDLKGLRHKLHGGEQVHMEADLPLTSMVDMMSILVVFLIMNFSSTGEVFFISKDIKIPSASNGRSMESLPLISVGKDGRVSMDTQKIGEEEGTKLEERDPNFPQLRSALQKIRILQQTIRPKDEFKGAVNIQADSEASLLQIKRVMNALISEGWTGINFAVRPDPKTE